MTNANILAAFIGMVLSISIVFLTRRDHISPLVAFRWFVVSLLVLLLGFFPGIVDSIGMQLGIGYPPIIPVLLGLGAALIKVLLMDIERQKMQVRLDRVVQRLAILEGTIESKKIVKAEFGKQLKNSK